MTAGADGPDGRAEEGNGPARAEPTAARMGATSCRGPLATVIGVLWYASAFWYYNGYRLPGM